MQIQIWKRRTKDNTKYNLYLRYRINQNKAKVESMRLWEWINPSNKIQEEHNDSVKKASEEIIRRVKDDIENDRVSISFENKKKTLACTHNICSIAFGRTIDSCSKLSFRAIYLYFVLGT